MKTVIEMAREAGFTEGELAFMGDNFLRFAELIRAEAVAKEREECAKVCDVTVLGDEYLTAVINTYADAIRNRSNK